MNHLGLFEGIGGFSLAARWMGWETVAWCEWNEFCQKVLRYHFPEADVLTDIKTTDFKPYANRIDILTGGFPCQPFSLSGSLGGTKDDRFLWPEMLRAIREVRPRWIVAENVYGITSSKFYSVFETICSQMEAEGYAVLPLIIPASSVGAPHQRDRVWFVAHAESKQNNRHGSGGLFTKLTGSYVKGASSYSQNIGREWRAGFTDGTFPPNWNNFPNVSPVCSGDDGIPRELDGITFPKWRAESLKAYGNAIVPQVALQIFKAIEKYESL